MEEQNLNQVTYKATLKLIDVNELDNLKLEIIDLKLRIEELKKDFLQSVILRHMTYINL